MNLTRYIADTAATVQCNQSGSCVVFASELCAKTLEGFKVVEGTVKFRGSVPFDHVWIEDDQGVKHDPTLAQFGFFKLDTAQYISEKAYSPARFAKAIKRHPEYRNFHTLKKI